MAKNFRRVVKAAVAGLLLFLATGAQAQLDYDYYGVVDLSYGHFAQSGIKGEKRFNSNSLSPSFLGVTGSYGFYDGWSVAVAGETFLRIHENKTGRRDTDPKLSRNAFTALRSPYGAIRVGRLQSLLFDTTNRFNALGNSIFSPPIRGLFQNGNIEGVQGDFYWDKALAYTSPTYEGATVNLMYATQKDLKKGHYNSGSFVWSVGLLSVEAAGQSVRVDDELNDPTVERAWQVGASYNFGFMKLFGLFSHTNDRSRINGQSLDVESRLTSFGATVPLGEFGSILAQHGRSVAEGPAVERIHTTTSAAYVYSYDSKTDIYVIGMDDRVRGQTLGKSGATGVRFKF